MTLANLLSASRLVLAPLLLVAARLGRKDLFLLIGVLALLTDCLDGYIARKLNQTSELGAQLDSWGDLALYMAVPLSVWWLWPGIIRAEALFVALGLAAFVIPLLAGFIKFGRLTCYHTWGAKLSAVLLSTTLLALLLGAPAWPFRMAVAVFLCAEVEELLITFLLVRWRPDVPSLWHVLRQRRRKA